MLRKAAIALIVLVAGIIVNILVVTAIFMIPCVPATVDMKEEEEKEEEEEGPQPAFGNLTTCNEVRSPGFIILGVADVFAAVLIVSELAKQR